MAASYSYLFSFTKMFPPGLAGNILRLAEVLVATYKKACVWGVKPYYCMQIRVVSQKIVVENPDKC
jgi:hypothetical protein